MYQTSSYYIMIDSLLLGSHGHFFNLVARTLLFGNDNEVFGAGSGFYLSIHNEPEDLNLWYKADPTAKFRNIVSFQWVIAPEVGKPQREHLVLNNDTRWNSFHLMIQRALEKKTKIETYINTVQNDESVTKSIPNDDILGPEDWKALAEIKAILEPF
ncbi:transposase-like protein [Colletotrichum incanum]|uniref:Transposase-like protein n=1 Tax=Colletotrichum incanum TaxID=1573173 RepID=A0A161YBT5_COLIC|nr:transposase-like protein [Colletotrichum incanum]